MPKTKTTPQPSLFADDTSPPLAEDARKVWGSAPAGRDCPEAVRKSCGSDTRAAARDAERGEITPEKLAAVVAASLFALRPWELGAVARLVADFTCPRVFG